MLKEIEKAAKQEMRTKSELLSAETPGSAEALLQGEMPPLRLRLGQAFGLSTLMGQPSVAQKPVNVYSFLVSNILLALACGVNSEDLVQL